MTALRHALKIILLGAALSLPPLSAGLAADSPKAAAEEKGTREKLDAAQRRLEEAAREVADLSMSMSDVDLPRFTTAARPRAFLGLSMASTNKENDGVELLSVSPGGAAGSAGLQAGDVITELNGKPLKRDGDESPRNRLFEVMRDVNPGDKLALRYRRAGKSLSGTIVAQAPPDRMFAFGTAGVPGAIPDLPRFAFTRSAEGVFDSAELVALTPKLGRYFGTDKGLLVVRAPEDERLKLEEGDVIVDIGGRVPESAAHASRILASYEKGEKLRLNVLRMKQKLSLDIDVPEHRGNRLFQQRLERSGGWGPATMPAPMAPPGPAAIMVPGVPMTTLSIAGPTA
jgi:type II secretory pathway component PulC